MVYRYRLKGYEEGWRSTRERRVAYQDLPRGTYTFEIEAVDRDLVYSEMPATVALTIHLPYGWIGLLSATTHSSPPRHPYATADGYGTFPVTGHNPL